MLPDDPVLKGRLFRAARALLHWNQAHLAARAGLSATTVNAIENTRHSAASTTSTRMVALALESAGIRFLGMTDGLGHGLRYAGTVPRRPAGTVLPFGQPHRPAAPGRASSGRAMMAAPSTVSATGREWRRSSFWWNVNGGWSTGSGHVGTATIRPSPC